MTQVSLRPFFSFYGSKWRMAPHYPPPRHKTIVEPFAGSAGYSLRYPDRNVVLFDLSPVICGIWDYLIRASESDIRSLPIPPPDTPIREIGLSQEAAWLIGYWVHQGSTHPGRQTSSWGQRKNQGWRPKIRERIAQQQPHIRHWKVKLGSYEEVENQPATWFIDPPYNNKAGERYYFSKWARPINFEGLGRFCRERKGQVIVCENEGATWLPFQSLGRFHAATKPDGRTSSNEMIWTN